MLHVDLSRQGGWVLRASVPSQQGRSPLPFYNSLGITSAVVKALLRFKERKRGPSSQWEEGHSHLRSTCEMGDTVARQGNDHDGDDDYIDGGDDADGDGDDADGDADGDGDDGDRDD